MVALLLFGAGATAQAGWLFVLSAGTFGFLVGSLFASRGLQAHLERAHPPTARVGDDVPVVMTVANDTRRALPFMRVEDRHDAFEPLYAVSERLRPGESGEIGAMRRVVRRGVFASGEIKLSTAAPLGFIRREAHAPGRQRDHRCSTLDRPADVPDPRTFFDTTGATTRARANGGRAGVRRRARLPRR
jgi:uncharacterized protein (DUF58 family)